MKPVLLVLMPVSSNNRALLDERFELHYAPTAAERAAAVAAHGARVEVVLTIGTVGFRPDEIEAMPKLRLLAALGAGYELLAVDAAKARGIAVVNGGGTNDDAVADHAFALLLASVRQIPQTDAACRRGVWRDAVPMQPQLARKKLGVLGLGTIGRKIAQRALGFDMAIGYHQRTARPELPHRYFDTLGALAQWCDVLVVATPGGASTKHLVNADVLKALGPQGHLVNIARGSVVDTAALAAALKAGDIAGAGLDVYESEPAPPAELVGLSNVVLTPHLAGRSPEALAASMQCFLDNVEAHAAGRPLRTPI